MRVVLASILIVVLAVACHAAEKYTTKYDNINIDEILTNDRLYKKYFNCLANKGPCTPDAKELKELIPDALKTDCAKCSEKQRKGIEKVLKYVIEKKRADFDELAKIYDPQGIYLKKYAPEAQKHGITL